MGSKIVVYLLTYIGVLTKPDRLPVGSRAEKMKAVLNGDRFTLGHGYFVVKNPSQDDIDRGLTHRDARMEERQFFERTEPWATTFRDYQVRLGRRPCRSPCRRRWQGRWGGVSRSFADRHTCVSIKSIQSWRNFRSRQYTTLRALSPTCCSASQTMSDAKWRRSTRAEFGATTGRSCTRISTDVSFP